MINIENYLLNLTDSLKQQFHSRLLYVGLQGSYLRGEATDNSDIDIMVIIDGLTISDLDEYRAIIQSLNYAEKSCGFICSKEDLSCWNPLEIANLLNGTRDYYGELQEFVPSYTKIDIQNFVKLSINNLYHEICHRYIHGQAENNLAQLVGPYKCVFFILQNLFYLTNGVYCTTKAELLSLLSGKHHTVLQRAIELNDGATHDFSDSFELLFTWCQDTLKTID